PNPTASARLLPRRRRKTETNQPRRMFMQKLRFLLPLIALGVLTLPAAASAQDGAAEASADPAATSRIERYLASLTTLSATFQQTLYDADGQRVQDSAGKLLIKRPGRFRWDYQEPYEQLVIADGERLWLYDADLEQATVKRLDGSLAGTPAMLLSGSSDVGRDFDVQGEYAAEGLVWLQLAARSPNAEFSQVRLAFRGDDVELMELTDNLDQITRIELSDLERNPTLPDDAFAFVPPAGTDVVACNAPTTTRLR
ncbi:MAG: outer membrane lipoprotein chaperone LolA, partial [Cyanobacteria bacterium P01_B01_bin.77]